MTDPCDPISLHLWDLRAQVEAELRCLTKVHRRYEQLPPEGNPERAAMIREMRQDIADVLTANGSIRGVAMETLDALNALAD
jgi:ribosomal protein L29